ncbi:MAG: hypothetical protein M3Y08_17795 [Fibrobacterota bacterium]|nr:hypothetical protein [Fibrobacterota bacterium]
MITKLKLARYKKFNGDLDKWVQSQKDGLDDVISGTEWEQIDQFIQRLRLGKHLSATMEYRTETDRVLKKNLEDAEAIEMAKGMA